MTRLTIVLGLAVGLLGCKHAAPPPPVTGTTTTEPVATAPVDFAGCDDRAMTIFGQGGRAHVTVADLTIRCAEGVAEVISETDDARYPLTAADWAAIWQPVPATWPACTTEEGQFSWGVEVTDEHGNRGYQCEETGELPAPVQAVVDAAKAVYDAKRPPT